MAYSMMKKLIKNVNAQYNEGSLTKEEYDAYKESIQVKIDVFYTTNRLTENQYEELSNMWIK